jgi:hypothetical protein
MCKLIFLHQVGGCAVLGLCSNAFEFSSMERGVCPFGGVCLLFLLSVCLASYEGHMVDALASRADEGRASLR